MEQVRIKVADLLQINTSPRTWRVLQIVEPRYENTLRATLSRFNREQGLPHLLKATKSETDGTITVYAKPKKAQP